MLRNFLLRERGFTLIEAVVALMIAAFIFAAVGLVVGRTIDSVNERQAEQTGTALTTEALEQVKLLDYPELAHDDSDTGLGGASEFDPDGPGPMPAETLVYETGVGLIPHQTVPENLQGVDFTITRWITWVDDPATPETDDYKRITVITEWNDGGFPRTHEVQAIVAPDALTVAGILAEFDLTPDTYPASTTPAGRLIVPLTVDNAGDQARFDMTSDAPADWTITLWWDRNDNGALDGPDFPLIDTNANALPDTGPVAAGAEFPVIAVIDLAFTAPEGDELVSITAKSTLDGGTDTTEIPVEVAGEAPIKYYLRHIDTPPTADSIAAVHNPMTFPPPNSPTLYNYSTDLDANPGRMLNTGGTPSSTSTYNTVNWVAEVADDRDFTGTTRIQIHVAVGGFTCKRTTDLVFLIRKKGSRTAAAGTVLGSASASYTSPNSGPCSYEPLTVNIPTTGVVEAGKWVELKILAVGRPALLAYDTLAYTGLLEVL
jgi:type II secretory pathway pseudopilin PulG